MNLEASTGATSAGATVAMILELHPHAPAMAYAYGEGKAVGLAPGDLVAILARLKEPTFVSVDRMPLGIQVRARAISAESEWRWHSKQLELLSDSRTMFGRLRSRLLSMPGATVRVGLATSGIELTAPEFADWVRNFTYRGSYSTFVQEREDDSEESNVIAELHFELVEDVGSISTEKPLVPPWKSEEAWFPTSSADTTSTLFESPGSLETANQDGTESAIMLEIMRCVGDGSNPAGLEGWDPPVIESRDELLQAIRLLPNDVGIGAFKAWMDRLHPN